MLRLLAFVALVLILVMAYFATLPFETRGEAFLAVALSIVITIGIRGFVLIRR